MKTGIFITFEGVENCGKTTISQFLVKKLNQMGFPTIWTREPGGTKCPVSEKIRAIILDPKNKICNKTEALLFAASRAQHIAKLIRPNLKKGINVVSDRFVDSSYIYQGIVRKLGIPAVKTINDLACGGLKPDITFLLDLDVKRGEERTPKKKKDRIEKEGRSFHEKIRKGYLELAKNNPKIIVIGAEKSEEMVCQEVLKYTLRIIKQKKEKDIMDKKWEKELIQRLQVLYSIARKNNRMFPEHDLSHALRVRNLCLYINKKDSLNSDREILIASALLHDLGHISDDSTEHIQSSMYFAKGLLPRINFPKEKINSVIFCIKNHDTLPGRLGWKEKVPMECKILRDADAIESLGCLGMIRYASWGGRHQVPFIIQYKRLDDKSSTFPQIDLIKNIKIRCAELISRCCTKTGIEIMQKRLERMKKFISEIEEEIIFAENLRDEF